MEPVEPPLTVVDPETVEAAVQRVVVIGQRLLDSDPSQVLGVLERQARQRLHQQNEILEYRRPITQLQQAVDQLKQQALGRVAPFRRESAKKKRERNIFTAYSHKLCKANFIENISLKNIGFRNLILNKRAKL